MHGGHARLPEAREWRGMLSCSQVIHSRHPTWLATSQVLSLAGLLASPGVTPLLLTTRAWEATLVADIIVPFHRQYHGYMIFFRNSISFSNLTPWQAVMYYDT